MIKLTIKSKQRTKSGTGFARALKRKKKIPASIYGFGINFSVSIEYKNFVKEYKKHNLFATLININFNQKNFPVILKEIQINPVTDDPIHIDFQLIQRNVFIKVPVSIKVINNDKSPGIKKGGILNVVKKNIILDCTPLKIPKYLIIDVSGFNIGKSFYKNDLILAKGARFVNEENFTILTITGRAEEKEDEEELEKKSVEDKKADNSKKII